MRSVITAIVSAVVFAAAATAFVQPAAAMSCTTQYIGDIAFTNCY